MLFWSYLEWVLSSSQNFQHFGTTKSAWLRRHRRERRRWRPRPSLRWRWLPGTRFNWNTFGFENRLLSWHETPWKCFEICSLDMPLNKNLIISVFFKPYVFQLNCAPGSSRRRRRWRRRRDCSLTSSSTRSPSGSRLKCTGQQLSNQISNNYEKYNLLGSRQWYWRMEYICVCRHLHGSVS